MSKSYEKKTIPTSDSTLPEETAIDGKEVFHVWICKVCKKPFAENEEKLVCEKCKHYCHAEHSSKYQMKVYDHLCLVDELGVSKQSYKILYGIAHGYSTWKMQKVSKLSSNEVGFIVTDLKKAGLVKGKLLFWTETTYKAHEVLPILEEIYGKEKDVESFVNELAGGSSGFGGIGIPGMHVSSKMVMFGILSVGILAIALIISGAVLSAMREIHSPSSLIVIVWILLMLGAVFLIYKLRWLAD